MTEGDLGSLTITKTLSLNYILILYITTTTCELLLQVLSMLSAPTFSATEQDLVYRLPSSQFQQLQALQALRRRKPTDQHEDRRHEDQHEANDEGNSVVDGYP